MGNPAHFCPERLLATWDVPLRDNGMTVIMHPDVKGMRDRIRAWRFPTDGMRDKLLSGAARRNQFGIVEQGPMQVFIYFHPEGGIWIDPTGLGGFQSVQLTAVGRKSSPFRNAVERALLGSGWKVFGPVLSCRELYTLSEAAFEKWKSRYPATPVQKEGAERAATAVDSFQCNGVAAFTGYCRNIASGQKERYVAVPPKRTLLVSRCGNVWDEVVRSIEEVGGSRCSPGISAR